MMLSREQVFREVAQAEVVALIQQAIFERQNTFFLIAWLDGLDAAQQANGIAHEDWLHETELVDAIEGDDTCLEQRHDTTLGEAERETDFSLFGGCSGASALTVFVGVRPP